MSVAKKKLKKQ